MEAIVLAGGSGKRLRLDTKTPKPLLKLNGSTLIDYQLKWLSYYGFDKFYVPSNSRIKTKVPIVWIKEPKEKLGTGGAIKVALEHVQGTRVYIFNVDDIVFYDPNLLIKEAYLGGAILVTKPISGFGRVEFDNANNIIKFEEKPPMPWSTSCGHYAMKRDILMKYLPKQGDVEVCTFQPMASNKLLRALEYEGKWITINTFKDLEKAKKELNEVKAFGLY
jgi:D-glycero-alpha-D-manno-heptose 1-phosphate guanylyltransferase